MRIYRRISTTFICEFVLILFLSSTLASPYFSLNDGRLRESDNVRRIGHLAYSLDSESQSHETKESKALSFFSSFIRDNKMITSVMDMVRRLSNNRPPHAYPTKAHPVKRYSTTQLRLSNSDTPRQLGPARDFKASLRLDQPIKSPTHTASQKSLRNEAWAETLFGPQGVLTAIFHMIDDRQKGKEPSEGGTHPIETNPTNAQYDLPFFIDMDFFKNAKPIDFAKIFQALVTNSQGDFEDPIAELPGFMGLCNRLSCGDIYKAIDQFRKSEFFSNFQTAMQLIQDPKGWEIIGDLLSNPDLIAQFTGGSGGLEKLLGSAASSVSSQTKIDKTSKARRPSTDVGPGDGDLGTDFSEMINERKPNKEKKPTAEELPEIAENVDETDYYNARSGIEIESGIDELEQIGGEIETVEKPDEIAPSLSKNINGEKKGEQLPQILESIDESEKTSIRIDGTDTLVIDKNGFNGGIATKTDRSSPPAPRASPTPSYTPTATRSPSNITSFYNRPTTSYWPYWTRTRIALATTTIPPYSAQTRSTPSRYTYPTRTYPRTYSTTQRTTTATRGVWNAKSWVTPTTARATTKNFRKDSDYYAMYYDDV